MLQRQFYCIPHFLFQISQLVHLQFDVVTLLIKSAAKLQRCLLEIPTTQKHVQQSAKPPATHLRECFFPALFTCWSNKTVIK